MDDYIITIVSCGNYWKLLVIDNASIVYWSSKYYVYKDLIYFKMPSKIEIIEDYLILYSKNEKRQIKVYQDIV
jgi:hypothetical protein